MNKFLELLKLNVNDKTEKRSNGSTELTYLSWSYAVAEFTKAYPDFKYEIKMFNGLPYTFDEKTGYMVFTSITADNQTKDMWLPVMDSNNKAMKDKPYEYTTKYGKKTVAPATMFDINKTIMRCLVKNMAMFGLGLYIYAGEDLPEQEPTSKQEPKVVRLNNLEPKQEPKKDVKFATQEQINMLKALGYKGQTPAEALTEEEAEKYIKMGLSMKGKAKKGA